MIKINGEDYTLKYNLGRMEMIETATGKPFMAEVAGNQAMMSLRNLKTYFAYGLKKAGEDSFVSPKEGLGLAEKVIEEMGYISANQIVMAQIQKDCPFFFRSV